VKSPLKQVTASALLAIAASASATEVVDGRWALAPYACDGELFTRPETPLLVQKLSIRWFSFDCTVVSSYKLNETLFLQARCRSEGRVSEIPVMLEPRGDKLRVGWNREPIQEMQRCRGIALTP
jgi:hypothetical protein